MARVLLLIALCLLPSIAIARRRHIPTRFSVTGKVYCDTCLAGFETSATTYIPGAEVKIECRKRATLRTVHSWRGVTDASGTYNITVEEDHRDQICDAAVVLSPQRDCRTPAPGRDGARVILTARNGIASHKRFVNAMGFTRDAALPECGEVMKLYQEPDEEED